MFSKLSFDSEGGSLVRSEFLKFGDTVDQQKPFVLLDESKARVYLAQTGLIGGPFASHKTPMQFTGERELKAGQNELNLTFESADTGGLKADQNIHAHARQLCHEGFAQSRQHRHGASGSAVVCSACARWQQA
jgi:YidC/Oxa1 family membrane protein insertase